MSEQLELFRAGSKPEPTEPQKWDKISGEMEQAHSHELERRRRKARELVYQNAGFKNHGIAHTVSADDVMKALNVPAGNDYDRTNHMNGLLFKGGSWVKIMYVKSTREGRHGSGIWLWTLKEYERVARTSLGLQNVRMY